MRALVLAFALVLPAAAQVTPPVDSLPGEPPTPEQASATPVYGVVAWDRAAFAYVYRVEDPLFGAAMRGANMASLPLFIAGPPAVFGGAWLTGGDLRPGYRLALAEGTGLAFVFVAKNLARRARPYASLPDVESRDPHYPNPLDPYSFPSGHALVSAALATSLSLSYPEWYVVVPSVVWAGTTALARVWHGVHFPGDVMAGAAIGVGLAVGVHLVAPVITPGFLKPDGGEGDPPAVVRLRLTL